MRRLLALSLLCALITLPLSARASQEMTVFSNPGYSGAQFTVTGPRETLNIPFQARSILLREGGSWQICSANHYGGGCQTISSSTRDLNITLASARPLETAPPFSPWQEIARLNVRDRAERDTAGIKERQLFREVRVCAERHTVRIRRADVQLSSGRWQRLFLPLALAPGDCSKAIDLDGEGRRLRAARFEYEAWSPGIARGTLIVQALPYVTPSPR